MRKFFVILLCLGIALLPKLLLAQYVLFSSPVHYGTGDYPYSVYSTDLDGDSDNDLAVANLVSDNVAILLNNGDGTFSSAGNYGAGNAPRSVYSTDLDGDSDNDLAVASYDGISILLNNGDGTFTSDVTYGTGNNPTSVYCADLDGDSDNDLAVANRDSDNVSILMNNGDGTFQADITYGTGDVPYSVYSTDLDGDSDNDLAVANYASGNVSILLNNGDGTFSSAVNYGALGNPYSVFSVDLDGDSDNDLAVADGYYDNVCILRNNGNGSFTPAVNYRVGLTPFSVYSTDLDGDSDNDLAIANSGSNSISTLLNNNDGTFTSAINYEVGSRSKSIFSADLDDDSDNDLVVANDYSGHVSILLNLGLGFPPTAYIDSIAPDSVFEGIEVYFYGHGDDPDGDVINYLWESEINGQLSTDSIFSTSLLTSGTHNITFKVQDDDSLWSVSDSAILNILSEVPTAYIDSITPDYAIEGEKVFFGGHGVDHNGEIISYLWESSIDGVLSSDSMFGDSLLSFGAHTISFKVQDNDSIWSGADLKTLYIMEQDPTVQWSRSFGAVYFRSLDLTTDGGYVFFGRKDDTTYYPVRHEYFLVKTDSSGNKLWSHIYTGSDRENHGDYVQQTSDGGYIVSGLSIVSNPYPVGDQHRTRIVKTDSLGDTLWTRMYGDSAFVGPQYNVVKETADGGYVTAIILCHNGWIPIDAQVLKMDTNGDSLWCQTYNFSSDDFVREIEPTADGGFIFTGSTTIDSLGGGNYIQKLFLAKTDSLGNLDWIQTYFDGIVDLPYIDWCGGFCVKQTMDNGYIAGGRCTWPNGDQNVYIVKTDSIGNVIWSNNYGAGTAFAVKQTNDGGYIVGCGGYQTVTHLVYKLDSYGNVLWTWDGQGSNLDFVYDIQQTADGGYIASGYFEEQYLSTAVDSISGIVKLSSFPSLNCEAIVHTPRVPNINGCISWDLVVSNIGSMATDVYGEIYPTVGDCASGTQYDFNLNRQITSNLLPGETFTGYYYFYPDTVIGIQHASVLVNIGSGVDNWLASGCFEFEFTYEWGRPQGLPDWGEAGQWLDREEEQQPQIPLVTTLHNCYPNPFNPNTTIKFDLAEPGNVSLIIYNTAGQLVKKLIDGKMQPGYHSIIWDASHNSSGIYFYKLRIGKKVFTKRMTLLK